MSDNAPADFVREFDAGRQAAEAKVDADALAADVAADALDDARYFSPEGAFNVTHSGADGVVRTGRFEYRLAVTAADFLALQIAVQRYTPPGIGVTGVAEMLAVLHVAMREVPDWIPRDQANQPDWLSVDVNLTNQLVAGVDAHSTRFRRQISTACSPAVPRKKLG